MSQVLVAGDAAGEVLVLAEPLSFWGGVDETTGAIIDVHHPQLGANVAGRVVVMPSGRGSSSSSSVLAELIRAGVGPAAILLGTRDPIVALGALVAEALYGSTVPVLVLAAGEYARAAAARRIHVRPSGEVEVSSG
jgi:predicted aconitase with swiveling domain